MSLFGIFFYFLPHLVSPIPTHQPSLLTSGGGYEHMLPPTHLKPDSCCSCCITGQSNTLECYPPSSVYLSSQTHIITLLSVCSQTSSHNDLLDMDSCSSIRKLHRPELFNQSGQGGVSTYLAIKGFNSTCDDVLGAWF